MPKVSNTCYISTFSPEKSDFLERYYSQGQLPFWGISLPSIPVRIQSSHSVLLSVVRSGLSSETLVWGGEEPVAASSQK